jgi:hypothetical protein
MLVNVPLSFCLFVLGRLLCTYYLYPPLGADEVSG